VKQGDGVDNLVLFALARDAVAPHELSHDARNAPYIHTEGIITSTHKNLQQRQKISKNNKQASSCKFNVGNESLPQELCTAA
jgi:hypothetical protein